MLKSMSLCPSTLVTRYLAEISSRCCSQLHRVRTYTATRALQTRAHTPPHRQSHPCTVLRAGTSALASPVIRTGHLHTTVTGFDSDHMSNQLPTSNVPDWQIGQTRHVASKTDPSAKSYVVTRYILEPPPHIPIQS